ncbi:MAG: hypothetical protein OHK0046_01170 [Anaerolineae bacterium]
MSFLNNRDGNLSLFRVGIAIAFLGAAIGVGGFVLVQVDQAQRRSPFYIDPYPGAVERFTQGVSETEQRVVYEVGGTDADTVAEYYQRELDDHLGSDRSNINRERCERVPRTGEFSDYRPGDGTVPFLHRCAFDNSTFNATQYTIVTIHPGIRNDATGTDDTGLVLIEYEQHWAR